jgi:hypothetical protein
MASTEEHKLAVNTESTSVVSEPDTVESSDDISMLSERSKLAVCHFMQDIGTLF